MLQAITWNGPTRVREAVASMGRTEDLCFSPANGRLAVVGFMRGRITVFDIGVRRTTAGAEVSLTGGLELSSDALTAPHGADFLDDNRLIVSCRSNGVSVFELPPGAPEVPLHRVNPVAVWPANGESLLQSPGSVCATPAEETGFDVLICNNTSHSISRHWLDAAYSLQRSEVLLQKWIDVPDGVAGSADRRFVAVSSHNTHQVFVYDASAPLHESRDPDAILRGAQYPHAVKFSADNRHLFLADAGAPFVHVYNSDPDGWRGVKYPVASLRIMDDATFTVGNYSPGDGGPKGLALDRNSHVLAVTSEYLPLAFFDLDRLMCAARSDDAARAQPQRDLCSELGLLVKHPEAIAYGTSDPDPWKIIDYMQTSRSWRLTAPLRRLDNLLRRQKPASE